MMIQVIVWLLVLLVGMLAPKPAVEQHVEQHVEQTTTTTIVPATTTTTLEFTISCEQDERSARGYCPGEEGAEQELANLGPCTETDFLAGTVPPCAGPVPPYLP